MMIAFLLSAQVVTGPIEPKYMDMAPNASITPPQGNAVTYPSVPECDSGWTLVLAYGRAMCAKQLKEPR